MTEWFRSWHGAPTDSKWLLIGRRVGVAPGIVSAIWWALLDHASQGQERGRVDDFDVESYAAFSGFDEGQIEKVLEGFREKSLIEKGHLVAWEKRQPGREDPTAALRQRKHRDMRDVTHGHAASRTVTTEESRVEESRGEKKEEPISSLRSDIGAPRQPEVEPPAPKPNKVVKGTRWSADAEIPDAWLSAAAALRVKHQIPPIDLRLEATRFSNYWASKAGGNATHVDWRLAWFTWVLRSNDKGKNGDGRHEKSRGHSAFLEGAFLSAQDDPVGDAGSEPH